MKTIDAYKKILKVIKTCEKDVSLANDVVSVAHTLTQLIAREEIQESFGISLQNCYNYGKDYFILGGDKCIAKYGSKYNRTISWSDDRSQPNDEWLLAISFPTGAYIFGEDYQTDTFNKYFEELKTFEPKYLDTANHCLYFAEGKAKAVYEKVDEIFKKYKAVAEEARKASKIEALKKQLEVLEG